MIREEIMLYTSIVLMILLAFYILPTYEGMTDSRVRYASNDTNSTKLFTIGKHTAFGTALEEKTMAADFAFSENKTKQTRDIFDGVSKEYFAYFAINAHPTMDKARLALMKITIAEHLKMPLTQGIAAQSSTLIKDTGRLVFTDALSGVHMGEPQNSAQNASEFANSDEYVLKSSIVTKSCTACADGAAAVPPNSRSPGDMDSIERKTEPSSFLNSFASFGR